MKRYLISIILLFTAALFQSCLKPSDKCEINDANITVPASEITNVQAYLSANGITATQHSSGFFYNIINAGTGTAIANLCTTVKVEYVGKLTNGNVFDQTQAGQTASFPLGSVILGWQKSLPLVSEGGTIRIYIPPTLGYGSIPRRDAQGNTVIPANSILIFDVTIVEVSNL